MLEPDYELNYDWYDPDSPEAYIFLTSLQNKYFTQSIDFALRLSDDEEIEHYFEQRGVKQSELLISQTCFNAFCFVRNRFFVQ
ncbi:MAG: hypothetical protein R2771_07790 [Saprospiraceae bacterium]